MAQAENPPWLDKAYAAFHEGVNPEWLNRAFEGYRKLLMGEEMSSAEKTEAVNKEEPSWAQTMMAEVRSHESPNHGYNDYFSRGFKGAPFAPPKELDTMTLKEVSDWQKDSNPPGLGTSVAGAYQIKNSTLNGLIKNMGLTGDELFDREMQDRMAMQLMEEVGLKKFLAGEMDLESFAEGMSKLWASLPVLRDTTRRVKKNKVYVNIPVLIGQSYYVGDGINKAFKGDKGAFEKYKSLYETKGRTLAPKETKLPLSKPNLTIALD